MSRQVGLFVGRVSAEPAVERLDVEVAHMMVQESSKGDARAWALWADVLWLGLQKLNVFDGSFDAMFVLTVTVGPQVCHKLIFFN